LAPVFNLERSIALADGATMFFNTMSVHDATAEEIDANSVTVQGVAALAPSARGTTAKMEYFMMNRV
jgi:hypothetical protein